MVTDARADADADLVATYEQVNGARLSPAGFAIALDRGTLPLPEVERLSLMALLAATERFPWSRRLRDRLWRHVQTHGRSDLVPHVARAAHASGAALSARLLIHDGERRFADGDVAGAVGQFRAAADDDPACAEAWNDLGVALHALGRPGAVESVTTGLMVGGETGSDCLVNRAAILLDLGRPAEARRDAARGLALDPVNAEFGAVLAATTSALDPLGFDDRMRLAA
jgi:tetratricopeptide (TPR) repeat protein